MGIFNRIKEVVRTIRFAASPRLYGRYSAGAGEGQEIGIGTGLQITSGSLTVNFGAVAAASHTHTASQITDFAASVAATSPGTHTHGNISNDGKIGNTSNLVIITGTDGVLQSASRSGIDTRTTFPNDDVTAATAFATANTLVRRPASGLIGFREGIAVGYTLGGVGITINVNSIVFNNPFGQSRTLTAYGTGDIQFPPGTGDVAYIPTGPYANDVAAAAGGVAVGSLYYTAAGAVLRRMS
jgi:hypothetical protein